MPRLVVATRRSALALAQTRAFIRALVAANPGLEVEELHVVTTGDRIQDRPLNEIGGKGLFVKEIEEALLEGRADVAVHSMKDLPAQQPQGLVIACVPERADPRDVLLVRRGMEPSLSALPKGVRVGSSSLRRKLAILRARPDAVVEPLRGNVDTRLRKLEAGTHEAIILAAAGLARIGIDPSTLPPNAPVPPSEMLPAVAQGILAIEAREGDDRVASILAPMEHRESRLRASAERGVLKALGADCTVPLAAHSVVHGDRLTLEAWLDEDGRYRTLHESASIGDAAAAEAFGLQLGARLLAG
ncbi:MAG: hydroxymethylbilane synthase [Deltaproteobacteria bacterium]|nr:hydroxymethylbilane synthase [Deltaproteobacteria bacterium]